MSSIRAIRESVEKDAKKLIKSGMIEAIGEIESTLKSSFPLSVHDLGQVEEAFFKELEGKGFDKPNTQLQSLITPTRNIFSKALSNISLLERYITLLVPQMEDGNNFGVTVQMTVVKFLKETYEMIEKDMAMIPSYLKDRADAVDAMKLPKDSTTESTVETQTENKGGKDGDEMKTSKVVTKEMKMSGEGKEVGYYRKCHLISLDVQMYLDLYNCLESVRDGYISSLDAIEKNAKKIESPKGTSGGNSMGMY